MKSKRNETLDLLKFISAFFVIFIHVPFGGNAGELISALSRFAVPVFFLSSGFFCHNNSEDKILKKLKRIALIFLFSSLLYNLTNLFFAFAVGEGVRYFDRFASPQGWINFILFNVPFSATRLWFLLSLVYVYILQYYIVKFKVKKEIVYTFSFVALILNVFIVELVPFFGWIFSISHPIFPEHYTRNFLFTGYPFFALGIYIKENFENKFKALKWNICAVLIGIGFAFSALSFFIVGDRVISVGACVIALSAFVLSINLKDVKYPEKLTKLFDCNLNIYIFHRPVETFIAVFLKFVISPDSLWFKNSLTALVCIFTLIFSLMLDYFFEKYKKQKLRDKGNL